MTKPVVEYKKKYGYHSAYMLFPNHMPPQKNKHRKFVNDIYLDVKNQRG